MPFLKASTFKISSIGLLKDLGSLIVMFLLMLLAVLFLVPQALTAQREGLNQIYLRNQRIEIEITLENTIMHLTGLDNRLASMGIDQVTRRNIILEDLSSTRFGPGGSLYLYAFDGNMRIVAHGAQKELVGKSLMEIELADGKILGQIIKLSMRSKDANFYTYDWPEPSQDKTSRKIGYAQRLENYDLTIATGFHPSVSESLFREFDTLSRSTITRVRMTVGASVLGVFFLFIILSLVVFFRVREIEHNLHSHLSELSQYRLILDESSIVSRTDKDGIIQYVNDRFYTITGHLRQDVIGKSHNIERHPDTPSSVFTEMWETISSGKVWHGLIKNKKADGTAYYKVATIVPLRGPDRLINGYLSSGQDISELIENRNSLSNVFSTDGLTGLGSRIKLQNDLGLAQDPSIAIFDIDDFSAINQAFGLANGDALLKQFGTKLLDLSRKEGYQAYRLAADGFALLSDSSEQNHLNHDALDVNSFKKTGIDLRQEDSLRINRLISALANIKYKLGDNSVGVNFRVGFARQGLNSLICADIALDKARQSKTILEFYDDSLASLTTQASSNFEALRLLNQALEGDGILLYRQPIFELKTGSITKYECLVRVAGLDGSILTPDKFLEVSKRANLYKRITARVIAKACRSFEKSHYGFSINLAVEDLLSDETVEYLCAVALESGVNNRIIVEIVETEELVDLDRAAKALYRIKSAGMRIGIDDFGAGYSNFKYLLSLEPSFIKIDGSIVKAAQSNERAKELIVSIVHFASQSGMETVAEFVDSEETLELMRNLGLDHIQGYYIGPPEPIPG